MSIAEVNVCHAKVAHFTLIGYCLTPDNDIILVFGCGGDRDKSKRPKMMKIAQDFSSKVFFTSDNNRYESLSAIASDAMKKNEQAGTEIIEDRQRAITAALQYLTKENILKY